MKGVVTDWYQEPQCCCTPEISPGDESSERNECRTLPGILMRLLAGLFRWEDLKVAAMSESVFRKRFRSSYESSPSLSPLDLPSRKHYRGTSKLVEDDKEDDDEEDEEIDESLDSDSVSEDVDVGSLFLNETLIYCQLCGI
ncbi:hypothetical protein Tco_1081638 [Tanacetum coccineum]|uniref:Uncharacterized protein n=1 Tax=Tanacetum coccineum TaxID=301880 RepID=A0ABQ5HY89_9ASTR